MHFLQNIRNLFINSKNILLNFVVTSDRGFGICSLNKLLFIRIVNVSQLFVLDFQFSILFFQSWVFLFQLLILGTQLLVLSFDELVLLLKILDLDEELRVFAFTVSDFLF